MHIWFVCFTCTIVLPVSVKDAIVLPNEQHSHLLFLVHSAFTTVLPATLKGATVLPNGQLSHLFILVHSAFTIVLPVKGTTILCTEQLSCLSWSTVHLQLFSLLKVLQFYLLSNLAVCPCPQSIYNCFPCYI